MTRARTFVMALAALVVLAVLCLTPSAYADEATAAQSAAPAPVSAAATDVSTDTSTGVAASGITATGPSTTEVSDPGASSTEFLAPGTIFDTPVKDKPADPVTIVKPIPQTDDSNPLLPFALGAVSASFVMIVAMLYFRNRANHHR